MFSSQKDALVTVASPGVHSKTIGSSSSFFFFGSRKCCFEGLTYQSNEKQCKKKQNKKMPQQPTSSSVFRESGIMRNSYIRRSE